MSFGSLDTGEDNAPMAEINMVPLIDVMLVLLVIFLVTAPLLTHAVKVELPRASSNPNYNKVNNAQLSINAQQEIFLNGNKVEPYQLKTVLSTLVASQPQIELHIRAQRTIPYEKVAQVMSVASRAGISKIGFLTDPSEL